MRILPDGYTQLEYIESTGTQYIDTGFKPNNNTRTVMDAQILAGVAPTITCIYFGCRGGGYFYELYKASTTNQNLTFLYGNSYSQTFSVDYSKRRTVEINKNTAIVDGVSKTYATITYQMAYSLYLGADNDAGIARAITPMRFHSCQIYDNGVLTRNFIPCKNSSGEVGLYDLVNGVFYGNAGTGAFIAGPEFSYNEVEYIESSGAQYVKTGVTGMSPLSVNAKFQTASGVSSADEILLGAYNGSYALLIYILQARWYMAAGTTVMQSAANVIADNTIYSVNATIQNGYQEFEVDGTKLFDGSNTAPGITNELFLGAYNNQGSATHYFHGRIYSLIIKQNNVLARDYIPVVGTDGVAGLWDKVEQVFYGNAGTGSFVAGAIIPEEPDVPPVEIPEMPTSIIAPYSDFANAVLMWNPVQGAETYNIQRDGVLVDATEMPFYYDHDLAAETVYSYAVTACNVAGESEPATIVAETTPFKLITDRTAEDVQAVLTAISTGVLPNDWLAGMKGAYNATDFNRVEAAVLFVLKRLEVAGWYLSVQAKTNWTFIDFPKHAEMQRYLENVRLLRAALPANMPAVPDTMRLLNYEDANRIEQILEMLDATVTNIMLNVYYVNEIYSGEV